MKSSLAAVAVLFFASCAHAQNSIPRATSSTPTSSGGAGYGSSGPFSGGYGSSGFSSGFSGGFSAGAGTPVVWEPPREFLLLYATNDGPFVPSTFMKYDEALALGKRQIAEQDAEALVSLADSARAAQAKRVPTFRLRSRVVQDDGGKLQICNLNGNDCHQL